MGPWDRASHKQDEHWNLPEMPWCTQSQWRLLCWPETFTVKMNKRPYAIYFCAHVYILSHFPFNVLFLCEDFGSEKKMVEEVLADWNFFSNFSKFESEVRLLKTFRKWWYSPSQSHLHAVSASLRCIILFASHTHYMYIIYTYNILYVIIDYDMYNRFIHT